MKVDAVYFSLNLTKWWIECLRNKIIYSSLCNYLYNKLNVSIEFLFIIHFKMFDNTLYIKKKYYGILIYN